jgi:hypothetical protein
MRKLTLDEIKADAARRGGRCLAETYVDSLTLMDWECEKGHRWRAVAHAIRQGHWCKRCADARLRHPLQALHALAASRGGKCLAERYANSQTKVGWECGRGHQWLSSYNSVKQGSWCPQCKAERRNGVRVSRIAAAPTAALCAASAGAVLLAEAPGEGQGERTERSHDPEAVSA